VAACTSLWIVALVAAASAALGCVSVLALVALALVAARRMFSRKRESE